jgi:YggT family protein
MILVIGKILYAALMAYGLLVLLRILISWVAPSPGSPFMRRLASVTDPALRLTRRACPLTLGGLDFSPVVLLVALSFLAELVQRGTVALGACCAFAIFCLASIGREDKIEGAGSRNGFLHQICPFSRVNQTHDSIFGKERAWFSYQIYNLRLYQPRKPTRGSWPTSWPWSS